MSKSKPKIGAIIEFSEMQVSTTIMVEPQMYWINLKEIPSNARHYIVRYEKAFASMTGVPQAIADLIADHKIKIYSGKVRVAGGEYLGSPLCEFVELRDGEPDRIARKAREAAETQAAEDDESNYLEKHLKAFIASRRETQMTFTPNEGKRYDKVTETVYFYNHELPVEGKSTRFVFLTHQGGWGIRYGMVKNGEVGLAGGVSFSNENDFELAQAKLLLIYRRLDTEEPSAPPRRTMRRR